MRPNSRQPGKTQGVDRDRRARRRTKDEEIKEKKEGKKKIMMTGHIHSLWEIQLKHQHAFTYSLHWSRGTSEFVCVCVPGAGQDRFTMPFYRRCSVSVSLCTRCARHFGT